MVKTYSKSSIVITLLVFMTGCGEVSFLGFGDKKSTGFKGGENATKDPNSSGDGLPQEQGQSDFINGGTRTDVEVDWGEDDISLYVPATVYYEGKYSGSDAHFTFFLQRLLPAPERQMREIIQARGDNASDTRVIDKACRCGKTTEFNFFWEHKSQQNRGTLTSPVYDQDPRLQGDWILAHNGSGSGWSNWYKDEVKNATPGNHTMFLGADTENPASSITSANGLGVGYLRTWCYAPNSPWGTKEHRWDSRDDMRIAITCNIDQCPDNTGASTEIKIRQHYSHDAYWKLPASGAQGAGCTQ